MKKRYVIFCITTILLICAIGYIYHAITDEEIVSTKENIVSVKNNHILPLTKSQKSHTVQDLPNIGLTKQVATVSEKTDGESTCKNYVLTADKKICLSSGSDSYFSAKNDSGLSAYQGIGWSDDLLEEDTFLETEIAPESIDLKDTFFVSDDVKDVDILE